MAARRFDHSLLYGPDIEKTLDFFTKALDFACAERVDMPDGAAGDLAHLRHEGA